MADLIDRQTAIEIAIEAADEWDGGTSFSRNGIIERRFKMIPAVHVADISKKADGDCISRQAAIDDMKDALDPHIVQFVKAKMAIEALPSVQPEPHWIPCSDRLPDVGSGIIFCDIDGDIFVGHRASDHWWSVDDKVKNVVAWMPLPEAYQKEGDT